MIENSHRAENGSYQSCDDGNLPSSVIRHAQGHDDIQSCTVSIGGIRGPGRQNQCQHSENRNPYGNQYHADIVIISNLGQQYAQDQGDNPHRENTPDDRFDRIFSRLLKPGNIGRGDSAYRIKVKGQSDAA